MNRNTLIVLAVLSMWTITAIVLLAIFVDSVQSAVVGTGIYAFVGMVITKLMAGGGNANPPGDSPTPPTTGG
jgi:hypothetical protein